MMTTALALLILGAAPAQVDFSVYAGQPLATEQIALQAWGSGTAEESTERSSAGQHSIKVTTSGYFQGAVLNLGRKPDLKPFASNKENLLAFSVFPVEVQASGGGSGTGSGGSGVRPGGMGGGGGATGAGVGSAGSGGGSTSATRPVKQMENLRVLIWTTDGKATEVFLPLTSAGKAAGRWVRVGIPVAVIPRFNQTNMIIDRIAVSGDARTVFYLGEIRVVTDSTPIQGFLDRTEMNLARGDEVLLTASAEAGYSVLEYAWDFNASNGVQTDATGAAVYHRFRIPGEYVVTCTIRDKYGLKAPWTGTIKVTVNP
jgi:hypothetical protein